MVLVNQYCDRLSSLALRILPAPWVTLMQTKICRRPITTRVILSYLITSSVKCIVIGLLCTDNREFLYWNRSAAVRYRYRVLLFVNVRDLTLLFLSIQWNGVMFSALMPYLFLTSLLSVRSLQLYDLTGGIALRTGIFWAGIITHNFRMLNLFERI